MEKKMNLSLADTNDYWEKKSPDLAKMLRYMDSQEKWTLEIDRAVEIYCNQLATKGSDILCGKDFKESDCDLLHVNVLSLMDILNELPASKALRTIDWLNKYGMGFNLYMAAEVRDHMAAEHSRNLFVARFKVIYLSGFCQNIIYSDVQDVITQSNIKTPDMAKTLECIDAYAYIFNALRKKASPQEKTENIPSSTLLNDRMKSDKEGHDKKISDKVPNKNHFIDDLKGRLFTLEQKEEFLHESANNENEIINNFIEKKLAHIPLKTYACSDKLFEGLEKLYENFPHFSQAIEYIEDYCYLQKKGSGIFYVPPTLFAGDSGVGKTFFSHQLSQMLSTSFEVLHMESMTASWVIAGSSSGWRDASPGKIFKNLVYKEYMNPIFLLDEIDKCIKNNYPPENTLLPLLERYTAKNFKDECIPLAIDASHIVWFATANETHKISTPLKNRFNIFDIPNPNHAQKKALIKNIYNNILQGESWGEHFESRLSDTLQDSLASLMTTGSARDLRKIITGACAKAVRHDRSEIRLEDIPKLNSSYNMGFI